MSFSNKSIDEDDRKAMMSTSVERSLDIRRRGFDSNLFQTKNKKETRTVRLTGNSRDKISAGCSVKYVIRNFILLSNRVKNLSALVRKRKLCRHSRSGAPKTWRTATSARLSITFIRIAWTSDSHWQRLSLILTWWRDVWLLVRRNEECSVLYVLVIEDDALNIEV